MAGGVITTGSYPSDLEPIGRHWFLDQEMNQEPLYPRIWEEVTTKRKFEHDSVFGGLGLASIKTEGASLSYDSMVQGPEIVYTQALYANGFIITDEMVKFAQTDMVMKNRSRKLSDSLSEKKGELLADILDNGFSNADGFDAKPLLDQAHPIQDGLTIRNELAVAADLSEASLEQSIIDIKDEIKDYRGKRKVKNSQFLIVSTEQVFEAQRILKNANRPASADHDINALHNLGMLKEEIMHYHRLTDADAWFLKLDVKDGLKIYTSESPTFASDNDFDTFNLKFKGYESYAYGWSDYRVLFGSPGA